MDRFILSSESLNRFGFWTLTAGIDLRQFRKNPQMYWMHQRPTKYERGQRQAMPIGVWKDIKVEELTAEMAKAAGIVDKELIGTKVITAEPEFDEGMELASDIKRKVEKGHLRMASAGLEPIAHSKDAKYLKKGQRNNTLVKCKMIEASIVDRGGNEDAFSIALYADGKTVDLSEGEQTIIPTIEHKNDSMEITLSDETYKVLELSAGASPEAIESAVRKLHETALQVPVLQGRVDAFELADKERKKVELNAILDKPELKLTAEQKQSYIALADANYEQTMTVLKGLQPVVNLSDIPRATDTTLEDETRKEWTFADYSEKDPAALGRIKETNPERYKQLLRTLDDDVHSVRG